MLKTIVQNEVIDSLRDEFRAFFEAVCADSKKNSIPKAFLEQSHFVAGRRNGRAILGVGGDGFSTVAASQDSNFFALVEPLFCDPQNQRSFSCATDGQVADADHNSIQATRFAQPGPVGPSL